MLPTKFWFIWPSGFRGEEFLNRPIRNKSCLWQSCLLMDRDKMSKLYSLFAENGVIVRNLNYRPWQWVYSISGCKSFPGGF
jgi:hypothetical protein